MRLQEPFGRNAAALLLLFVVAAVSHAQTPGKPFEYLQQQIDDVRTQVDGVQTGVAQEAAARQAADARLQQQISDVNARVNAAEAGLARETAARQAGDAASRDYTDRAVQMEAEARRSGEAASRTYADAAVRAEAEARKAAAADLQKQIDRQGGSNTGSGTDGALRISRDTVINRAFLAGMSANAGFELHLSELTVDAGATLVVDAAAIFRVAGPVAINGNIIVTQAAAGGTVIVGGAFGLDAGGNGGGLGAGLGGTNSNAAGGGGANAGRGGNGQFSGAGRPYPYRLQPWGSGGGAGQTTTTGSAGGGGWGGGSLIIVAKGAVDIEGVINADGSGGGSASNGGGGGSGGTIAIFSETSITSTGGWLSARGGSGGNRGGGGGGGYVVLVAPSVGASVNEAVQTAGGAGFQNGENGKVIVRSEAPRPWAL